MHVLTFPTHLNARPHARLPPTHAAICSPAPVPLRGQNPATVSPVSQGPRMGPISAQQGQSEQLSSADVQYTRVF